MELTPFKKGIKSDDPPQNVEISHLSDPTSTTNNSDETYPWIHHVTISALRFTQPIN